MDTDTVRCSADILRDHLDLLDVQQGNLTVQAAHDAAAELHLTNRAVVDFSPGTGTRFALVVTDVTAYEPVYGGDTLIAWPELRVCLALTPTQGIWTADYVSRSLKGVRGSDAEVVALFLTALGDRLTELQRP